MELGIGMFGDMSFNSEEQSYQPASDRLKEIIEQVRAADSLGIDVFAMGEHHREDYAVSSPEIVLAALSSVTRNIRLSSGVSVLSSVDPVKLFQDFSTIELLSDGRVEIMAGRGSFTESFPLFGYNLSDYNALFEEKLQLLLQLNQNRMVTWNGRFRAPIHNQIIYPQIKRSIPVWIAVGGTPASVLRAAQLGLPLIIAIIGGMPGQFIPLVDYYHANFKRDEQNPVPRVAVHAHTFVADSMAQILRDYYPHYARQMDKIGKERGWRGQYTEHQFAAGTGSEGALFMGEPEEVAEKIIRLIEMLNLSRFIAHIDCGGPSHSQLMKTIELLGLKVFPTVRRHFESRLSP